MRWSDKVSGAKAQVRRQFLLIFQAGGAGSNPVGSTTFPLVNGLFRMVHSTATACNVFPVALAASTRHAPISRWESTSCCRLLMALHGFQAPASSGYRGDTHGLPRAAEAADRILRIARFASFGEGGRSPQNVQPATAKPRDGGDAALSRL